MWLKRMDDCPCGCGAYGIPLERRSWHVKACECPDCRRPRTGSYKRRTAPAAAAYMAVRQSRALYVSGRCEAHDMHADGCDGYGTQAHHVRPVSLGGTDVFENLRWVHHDCHARIHSRPAEARELGLLERGRRHVWGPDDRCRCGVWRADVGHLSAPHDEFCTDL